ncbi:MAG: type II secretion system F family protein [bacterium]
MPNYKYKAITRQGNKIRDELEAASKEELIEIIKQENMFPVSIKETISKNKELRKFFDFFQKIKDKQLAFFTKKFSLLLKSGMPIIDALKVLEESTVNEKLKKVIIVITKDVENGMNLTDSFFKHKNIFPELYCQLIKAGEKAGVLTQVLDNLSHFYKEQSKIKNQIKSTLYYPVTVIIISVIIITFLFRNIVPRFVSIIISLDGKLPLITRMIMRINNNFYNYILFFLSIIFFLVFIVSKFKNTYYFDYIILKIPLLNTYLKTMYIYRFIDTLSILLQNNLDLLTSLEIVKEVIGNKIFQNIIYKSSIKVQKGKTFASSLVGHKLIPVILTKLIKTGEKTGQLPLVLEYLSQHYQEILETYLKKMVSMMEPVIIIFLAIIVGTIIISIMMPILDIYSYL